MEQFIEFNKNKQFKYVHAWYINNITKNAELFKEKEKKLTSNKLIHGVEDAFSVNKVMLLNLAMPVSPTLLQH